MFLVEPGFAFVDVVQHQQHAVVDAVDDVVPLAAVPDAHQGHVHQQRDVRGPHLVLEHLAAHESHQQAGVDVVAQPEGQCDVPAVPEIFDRLRQERQPEVLRGPDAEQIRRPDRHQRIPREVEEQVEAVVVHVADGAPARIRQVTHPARDQRRQGELVEGPEHHQPQSPAEDRQVFPGRETSLRILQEPARPVDRAGRDRREEGDKVQVVEHRLGLDQLVGDLDDHLDRAEGQVRGAKETQAREVEQPRDLHQHQRQQGQQHGGAPLPNVGVAVSRDEPQVQLHQDGLAHQERPEQDQLLQAARQGQAQHRDGREQPVVLQVASRQAEDDGWQRQRRQHHEEGELPEAGDHRVAFSAARSALPLVVSGIAST